MRPSRFVVPLVASIVLTSAISCRPEVVVRLATQIFVDGSLERSVALSGRSSEGEPPADESWYRKTAGIELAQPDRWPRVDRSAGGIEASGFFANAESLPPILTFHNERGVREDPSKVELSIEMRGVLRRWSYVETHGDPFGAADRAEALQALTQRAVEVFRDEFRRSAGAEIDPWPAEAFLREQGVSLAQALLQWRRTHSGLAHRSERAQGYARILRQAGVRGVDDDSAEDFWERTLPNLLEWGRAEMVRRLEAEHGALPEGSLDFWPAGSDWSERAESLLLRHWDDDDDLWEEIAPHLEALGGRYSGELGTRFRFEIETALPGTLLRTNGTPVGNAAFWLFRESDLAGGEMRLRAVSAEALPDALVALGARRDLGPRELLQLEDLLWRRDPDGVLLERLEEAIRAGSLDGLREEAGDEDLWIDLSRELAAILDPNADRAR